MFERVWDQPEKYLRQYRHRRSKNSRVWCVASREKDTVIVS